MYRPILIATLVAGLAACAKQTPPAADVSGGRPLEVLQPDSNLSTIRADLIATARERFGRAAVERALAAPTHLFVKRFYGMAPPPPPGAGPDWRPQMPAALLIRDASGWEVATAQGWRPAKPEAAAEIDALLASAALWSEAQYTPPCPDYGANLVLLKLPGRAETVRHSLCISQASSLGSAALNA